MNDIAEQIGALVGSSVQRKLFVCLSEPAGPPDAEFPILPEHLRHLIAWEQQGVLFASGPFMEAGQPGQRAMYVIRAESLEHAKQLVSDEPFHKRGMRTFTLHEWSLNQGRISLQMDFSNQHAGLD